MDILQAILGDTSSWLGLLSTVGLTLLTYLANKYLIPFLQVGRRQHYAEYIAAIADDVTDDLRLKYSDNVSLTHLDDAVDSLIDICGISTDIARRAVNAAAARK